MSHRPWRDRLRDILEGVEESLAFTSGMSYENFARDAKTRKAVLANFAIIGEAASRVPDEIAARYPGIPWRSMRDMRNLVVHAYFQVEAGIVWRTIQEDLPALTAQIRQILDSGDDS